MRHPWAPKNDILLPHDGADTSPNGSLASGANDGSSNAPIVASSSQEIPDEMTIPEFLVKQLGPLVAKMMEETKSDREANYVAKCLDDWVNTYFRHPEKLIKEPIAPHWSPYEYGWSGYTNFRNLLKYHLSGWVKHYKYSVNEDLVFQALDLFERIMKNPQHLKVSQNRQGSDKAEPRRVRTVKVEEGKSALFGDKMSREGNSTILSFKIEPGSEASVGSAELTWKHYRSDPSFLTGRVKSVSITSRLPRPESVSHTDSQLTIVVPNRLALFLSPQKLKELRDNPSFSSDYDGYIEGALSYLDHLSADKAESIAATSLNSQTSSNQAQASLRRGSHEERDPFADPPDSVSGGADTESVASEQLSEPDIPYGDGSYTDSLNLFHLPKPAEPLDFIG